MKPHYAMTALYPPTVIDSVISNKRYAVSGSQWIEVGPEVTQQMVQAVWTPLHPRGVQDNAKVKEHIIVSKSSGKTYSVTQDGNRWSCSCPAFGFRRSCKHIEEAKKK